MEALGLAWRRITAYPALCFVVLAFFYPLFNLLLISLHSPEFSIREYTAFLNNSAYVEIAIRTLLISFAVTAISLSIGYPTALLAVSVPSTIRGYVLIFVIVPYLTSILVRTYAWTVILGDTGVINSVLIRLNIIERPLELIFNRTGIMIAMVHIMLPIMILPIYSAMRSVDASLTKASAAMGAGQIRSFCLVYMPQTLAGVKSGVVLVFVISLGFYITPAALGGLNDVMLSTLIESEVNGSVNFPSAAAISFLLLVATFGIYLALEGLGRTPKAKGHDTQRAVPRRLKELRGAHKTMHLAQISTLLSGYFFRRRVGKPGPSFNVIRILSTPIGILALLYLVAPSVIVVIISFSGDDFLSFPPNTWSLRWYSAYFSSEDWREATWASFQIAVGSTFFAVILGWPVAYAISRGTGRESRALHALFLAPLIVPGVVVGVASYSIFVSWGLLGTKLGLLVAHTCGGLTYVVSVVTASLMRVDPRLEGASSSLGAGRLRTVFRVVAPLSFPGLTAGALFAFIHSFDEVVTSSFIAGIRIKTLPLKMWEDIRNQVDPTIAAVSALLIIIPLLMLPILDRSRS